MSHAVRVNVRKELPKVLFVVAANQLAESLVFLGLEEQDGHFLFGQIGSG